MTVPRFALALVVLNALGAALLSAGNWDAAVAEFHDAVRRAVALL